MLLYFSPMLPCSQGLCYCIIAQCCHVHKGYVAASQPNVAMFTRVMLLHHSPMLPCSQGLCYCIIAQCCHVHKGYVSITAQCCHVHKGYVTASQPNVSMFTRVMLLHYSPMLPCSQGLCYCITAQCCHVHKGL